MNGHVDLQAVSAKTLLEILWCGEDLCFVENGHVDEPHKENAVDTLKRNGTEEYTKQRVKLGISPSIELPHKSLKQAAQFNSKLLNRVTFFVAKDNTIMNSYELVD